MTFIPAVREIESHEFSARVNVASGLRIFLASVASEEAVKGLSRLVAKDRELAFKLLRRAGSRAQESVDQRYENPWDAAVAASLWIVSNCYPELTAICAEVSQSLRQSWWTRKLGHEMAGQWNQRSNTAQTTIVVSDEKPQEATQSIAIRTSETAEYVLSNPIFASLSGDLSTMKFFSPVGLRLESDSLATEKFYSVSTSVETVGLENAPETPNVRIAA
jgi:hypothetical protein